MSKRRTHSSIDKLPAELTETLTRMVADNQWPDDFTWLSEEPRPGHPRYEDMVEYARQGGFSVSPSAMGRWGKSMRTLIRMKNAGVIARDVMSGITDEDAGQAQKAVAEMMTAVIIDAVADSPHLKPKDLLMLCAAARDCTRIALTTDKYSREQVATKVKTAAGNTKEKLTKAGVDRKLIREIMDEYLGVVTS